MRLKKENIEEKESIYKEPKLKEFFIKNKKSVIISIIVLAIILVILFLSTIFALTNIGNAKIISKVRINGIEIGNLTREEAIQKLEDISSQKLNKDILIKGENFEYEINLSQRELNYNIEKAIQEAYSIGRNGNIFSNNYEILNSIIIGNEINLDYTYNEKLLNKLLKDIDAKIPNHVTQANYSIEDDKLIITPGKKGNSVNTEEIKQNIIDVLLINNTCTEINIELIEQEPAPIDIDKIYEEVHTEPKDAYYTKDPFKIFPHVNGVDFNLEKARKLLEKNKKEYVIKLKITIPKVTTDQIGTEAFPDLLSSFSTRYDESNINRTINLELAMDKLDGTVVPAGEIFSYNDTVGKRTAEAGYREAGGYAGGRVVQTLAGGICQTSSTLYDAVVYANLEIVERHNHMFLAGYVDAGEDATVVYGAFDFRFKNTRKYPIMIKTSIGGGVAKIDIYGIKEKVEYDVDIVTTILSYTPFSVTYEDDSSLSPGEERVSQYGMNGCKSITYKVLKLNGTEVSREVLSSDTYDPMDKIIYVGPKETKKTTTNNKTNDKTKEKNTNKKETTKEDKNKTKEKTTNTNTTNTNAETNVVNSNTIENNNI